MATVDEILGEEKLPSADDILNSASSAANSVGGRPPAAGEAIDNYVGQGPIARVLNSFGQGFKDGWGSEPIGIGQETEQFLRKAGIFNDYKNNQTSLIKSFNEALIRPAAAAVNAAWRGLGGAMTGAAEAIAQGGQEAQETTVGRALNVGTLAREVASVVHGEALLPEVAPQVMGRMGAGAVARAREDTGLLSEAERASAHAEALRALSPRELAEARELRVVGDSHAAWEGTAEPRPVDPDTVAEAVKARIEEAKKAEPEGQPAPQPEAPKDIHAVAREVDPQTFQQYDALTARRDTFRRWIDELGEQRAQRPESVAAQNRINDILAKVNGVEERLTKAARGRLEEARADLTRLTTTDTADMARVRQDLQKTDYAMRDLAPRVSAAYREAQTRMPAPEDVPAAPPAAAESPEALAREAGAQTPAGAAEVPANTRETEPTQEAPTAQPQTREAAQRVDIADDVTKKLIAAGRPEEEAQAAGAVAQAHAEARAARFTDGRAPEAGTEIVAGGERKRATGKTVLKDGQATITLFKNADASTFIHESGHHWLEELMGDAQDEAATPQTKADAETVRTWLGTKEGEEITRAQHEKFARGFERYMMEGTAPSQALAGVFAKFKTWLTDIYQTVARLRSPINDDIRAVFDRMLAAPEERAVIAPEREAGHDFATRHEAEAARAHEITVPEEATAAADKIRAEAETEAAAHPETADEFGGRQDRGNPPDGTPPDRGGNAGQPKPGGEGPRPEPGTVGTRGTEAERQGGGVAVAERQREATAEPRGPGEPFAEPAETRLVDKAGNIRLDNLGTPEDVNVAIRTAADTHNDFIEARRGVVSDAQVLDLADALGMDAATLNRRQLGEAFNAEQIVAARKLLIQSATAVRDAAKLVEGGTDAQVMAFGEAVTRHRMIQEHVAGITAEAGRALRAFRAIEGMAEAREIGDVIKETTGRTLFQMRRQAQAIANLPTPGQVSGAVNALHKPGIGAMALEVFKNWLISGPITHSTYAIGNTALALWKATAETAGQATVGAIRHNILGQTGPRIYFGEVPAQLYAMIKGQRDGWRAGWDSLKAGQTMALPHEIMDSLTTAERTRLDALMSQGATFEQAVDHLGIQVQATTPFTNTAAIPNPTVGGVTIPLGSIVRAPGERMVAPIHSYFRTIGYLQNIARQAYRMATDEGLEGNAFATRVAQLTRDPTEEMMTVARNEATQQTLMGRGGELTKRVTSLVNWEANIPGLGPTRPLAFIDPFVHVASNIMEQASIERTPLGLATSKIRADLRGVNGDLARDTTIARMALGTSLGVVVGGLALEGLVTPSAPSDPKEAAMSRMVNGAPHAAHIGGMSIELNRLGVLGLLTGISADIAHAAKMGADGEDLAKVAHYVVHSFVQNFMDEGFMKGPSDLIKALDEPDRFGAQYVKNFVTSFAVPYSVGMSQIARQVDPFAREAHTLMEQIKSKVPWWSESLMPRRDIWGEPVLNREFAGVYTQRVANDPVNKTLLELGIFPTKAPHQIRGVDLTEQQYDDFSRISGRLAKARLDPMVRAPGFSSLPAGVRHDMIENTIKSARETASTLIQMQNPDIIRMAVQGKRDHLETGKRQTHLQPPNQ